MSKTTNTNLLKLHIHKLRKATAGGAHKASVIPLRFVYSAVFNYYMIIYHLAYRIFHALSTGWNYFGDE